MIQSIELSLIDPPLFNSRLTENLGTDAELKQLGDSLKERQLQPIGVVLHSDGKRYRLVWGSRRTAAAKSVGMETIAADVLEDFSEADEAIANGIENVRRKDLSTFETARLAAHLRDLKMSLDQVAAKLGLSKQHVSNLAICFQQLPAEVKKAWKDQEPGTDMTFLRAIVTKDANGKKVSATPEEMIAAWNERKESLAEVSGEEEEDEEDEEDDDDGTETASAPAPQRYSVHKDRYRNLLRVLRKIKAAQITIDVCRYLVGDIEKVRGVPIGDDKAPTKKNNTNKETK